VVPPCRRRSYTPKYNSAPKKDKQTSYWDRVNWDLQLPLMPDKWYVRVAWLLLLVGTALYVNYQFFEAKAAGIL
jgi:hypothetical protein